MSPAIRDPTTAVGTDAIASIRATFQSMVLALAWAMTPEAKPNTSVISAAPIATFGSRPRARMNRGERKVAPPIPAPLAIPAMTIATGSKYQ